MNRSRFSRYCAALVVLAVASRAAKAGSDTVYACDYRQAGFSVPAIEVGSADTGHPWRATYGYCLWQNRGFVLHQDWALSYLDAKPFRGFPGGNGVGIGTDLLFRWHPGWQPSILPYIDAGVGVQYAAGTSFPADGSRWMFTLHAGPGWLVPLRRERQAYISLRYLHLSNAGVVSNNSGYDVLHLVFGMRWGQPK